MGHRAPRLIETPPKFTARGGLFYVDFGLEELPVIALCPSIMLKAIARAKAEYEEWTLGNQREASGH